MTKRTAELLEALENGRYEEVAILISNDLSLLDYQYVNDNQTILQKAQNLKPDTETPLKEIAMVLIRKYFSEGKAEYKTVVESILQNHQDSLDFKPTEPNGNEVIQQLKTGYCFYEKNDKGKIPLNNILPDELEQYLNDCIEYKGHDIENGEIEYTINFSSLTSLIDIQNGSNNNLIQTVGIFSVNSLLAICDSPNHTHLLEHPTINTYLMILWKMYKNFYLFDVVLYFLHFILLWFIQPGSRFIIIPITVLIVRELLQIPTPYLNAQKLSDSILIILTILIFATNSLVCQLLTLLFSTFRCWLKGRDLQFYFVNLSATITKILGMLRVVVVTFGSLITLMHSFQMMAENTTNSTNSTNNNSTVPGSFNTEMMTMPDKHVEFIMIAVMLLTLCEAISSILSNTEKKAYDSIEAGKAKIEIIKWLETSRFRWTKWWPKPFQKPVGGCVMTGKLNNSNSYIQRSKSEQMQLDSYIVKSMKKIILNKVEGNNTINNKDDVKRLVELLY